MKKSSCKLITIGAASALLPALCAAEEIIPATFDDLGLPKDLYWCGDPNDPDYLTGSFRSGSFEFSNYFMSAYMSWAWFAYASYGSAEGLTGMDAQFYNTAGGGYGSDCYGVVYYADFLGPALCSLADGDEARTISGMWVCNSAWTRDFIANGDGFSTKFGRGDKLTLTVKGTSPSGNQTETSMLLADCSSPTPAKWTYADDWTWMDLSSLGPVSLLEFVIESTKKNQYGDVCPTYCCIDDLGAEDNSSIPQTSSPVRFKVTSVAEGISISSSIPGFSASLYDMSGSLHAHGASETTNLKLAAEGGIYILRLKTSAGIESRKIRI